MLRFSVDDGLEARRPGVCGSGRARSVKLLEEVERLQQKIHQVEQRLAKLTEEDPFVQKLCEQPGIGLVTAVTPRADLGKMSRSVRASSSRDSVV